MWQGCAVHHLLQAIAGASGRPTRAVNGKVLCLGCLEAPEKRDLQSGPPLGRQQRNAGKGGPPYKIRPRCPHMSGHRGRHTSTPCCIQLPTGVPDTPPSARHGGGLIGRRQQVPIKIRQQIVCPFWQGWAMHHLLQAISGASGRPTRAVNGKVVCWDALHPPKVAGSQAELSGGWEKVASKNGGLPYKICPRCRHMLSH